MPSIVDLGSGHADYLTYAICHIHHKIKLFWDLEAPFWGQNHRFKKWTKSIAVGNKPSVNNVKDRLGFRFKGRKIIKAKNQPYFYLFSQIINYLPWPDPLSLSLSSGIAVKQRRICSKDHIFSELHRMTCRFPP